MAQLWFNLAQHSERQDAEFLSKSVSRLRARGEENGDSNGDGDGDGEEGR